MRPWIRTCSVWVGFSIVASAASAVTLATVQIGDVGNAADTTGYGSVGYGYAIGTYEVTNAQYAEFLNAKAASDPLGLWSPSMTTENITQSGVSGSFTYSVVTARADRPVTFVSFYDTLRFANWMSNGQGLGDTESGSYTLTGGTAIPTNALTLSRNPAGTYVVTSEDEWYKAAYYNQSTDVYTTYPTHSNTLPVCSAPTATPNRANCGNAVGATTNVGSYTGSPSANGTYDQGGNVWEWNEAIIFATFRGIRGGSFNNPSAQLDSSQRIPGTPETEFAAVGFRLAYIPEPGTALLLSLGLVGLAARRRAQSR